MHKELRQPLNRGTHTADARLIRARRHTLIGQCCLCFAAFDVVHEQSKRRRPCCQRDRPRRPMPWRPNARGVQAAGCTPLFLDAPKIERPRIAGLRRFIRTEPRLRSALQVHRNANWVCSAADMHAPVTVHRARWASGRRKRTGKDVNACRHNTICILPRVFTHRRTQVRWLAHTLWSAAAPDTAVLKRRYASTTRRGE